MGDRLPGHRSLTIEPQSYPRSAVKSMEDIAPRRFGLLRIPGTPCHCAEPQAVPKSQARLRCQPRHFASHLASHLAIDGEPREARFSTRRPCVFNDIQANVTRREFVPVCSRLHLPCDFNQIGGALALRGSSFLCSFLESSFIYLYLQDYKVQKTIFFCSLSFRAFLTQRHLES